MTEDLKSRYPDTTWQEYPGGIAHNNSTQPQDEPASSPTQPYHTTLSHQSSNNTSFQYPDPESCQLGGNTYNYSPSPVSAPIQNNFYLPLAQQHLPQGLPPIFNSMTACSSYVPNPQYGQYSFMQHPFLPSPQATFHQPFYQHWPQPQQGPLPTTQSEAPLVDALQFIQGGPRVSGPSIVPRRGTANTSRPPRSSTPSSTASQSHRGKKAYFKGRGEGVPIWEDYLCPKMPLPKGLSLYQIANQYPNHLSGIVLDDFVRARWSAPEIQSCMPQECQDWLEKRKNNNDEEIVDKTMWLQKRLQKRRKLLQNSTIDKLRVFWETPQQRLDGRPRHAAMGASLRPPQQAFLQKNHILNTGPTGSNSNFHGNSAWIEPPGTSYFRLDPDWVPPAPPPASQTSTEQQPPSIAMSGRPISTSNAATTATPVHDTRTEGKHGRTDAPTCYSRNNNDAADDEDETDKR